MATRQTARKPAGRQAKPAARRAAGRTAASAKGGGTPARAAAEVPGTARGAGQRAAGAWRAAARWAGGGVPLATLVVSVLGLADSAYLTYQHFSQATTFAGCSDKGAVNCEAVTTSAWSYLFGSHLLPVSVLGLAFFAFMAAVNSPWGWRAPWPAVHWARLGSVVVGMLLVVYLIWAELFRINAICLYCTGVHALTFILFALIVGQVTYAGVRAIPKPE